MLALGAHAEGTLAGMVDRSKVKEHNGHAADKEMIQYMHDAQVTVAESLAGCGELAANHGDTLPEDLCIARGQVHEKFAWMLKSHLV